MSIFKIYKQINMLNIKIIYLIIINQKIFKLNVINLINNNFYV